jgi:hypothetical protein
MAKKSVRNVCVGFDMDGVLVDHTKMRARLARRFGYPVKRKDTPSDMYRQHVPEDVRRQIQDLVYHTSPHFLKAPLIRKVRTVLSVLRRSGIPYVLISRRKNPALARQLLKKRGLWPLYFNTQNTRFVFTREEKNIEAERFGVTHYIDDEADVLAALSGVTNKFLFDPYGVLTDSPIYRRFRKWDEFLDVLIKQ